MLEILLCQVRHGPKKNLFSRLNVKQSEVVWSTGTYTFSIHSLIVIASDIGVKCLLLCYKSTLRLGLRLSTAPDILRYRLHLGHRSISKPRRQSRHQAWRGTGKLEVIEESVWQEMFMAIHSTAVLTTFWHYLNIFVCSNRSRWDLETRYDTNNNDSRAAVDPLGYPQAKIHGQMLLFLLQKCSLWSISFKCG